MKTNKNAKSTAKIKSTAKKVKDTAKQVFKNVWVRFSKADNKWSILDQQELTNILFTFDFGVMKNVQFFSRQEANKDGRFICGGHQGSLAHAGIAICGTLEVNNHGKAVAGLKNIRFDVASGNFLDGNNDPVKEAKYVRLMSDRRALWM
jgi:hypothetical protein